MTRGTSFGDDLLEFPVILVILHVEGALSVRRGLSSHLAPQLELVARHLGEDQSPAGLEVARRAKVVVTRRADLR